MEGKSSSTESDSDYIYSSSKEFSFFGQRKTIVLHSGKGSDSLLSICNALILRGDSLIEDGVLADWELLELLRNEMEELCPATLRESLLSDALSRTPDLVDYQPKPLWHKIDSFKNNDCSGILKVLEMPLYHGWIKNDENADIGESASSPEERIMLDMKGGITEFGLSSLIESLQNHEIFLLVHDDKLNTAIKCENEIYLLITEKILNNMGLLWRNAYGGAMFGDDFQEATGNSSEDKDGNIYSTTDDCSFFGQKRTIFLHNGQGLDSLVSICNTLILRYNLAIEGRFNKERELLDFLRNKMEELCPAKLRESLLSDALSRTTNLVDYQPKPLWNRIDSFKNNDCSEILKVLEMPLYHGWIKNDENAEPKSIDDLEKADLTDSEREMTDLEGRETECGLSTLKESIKEHELCVLVRDDIFYTATQHDGELYFLEVLNGAGSWRKLVGEVNVGQDLQEEEEEAEIEEDIEAAEAADEIVHESAEEMVNDDEATGSDSSMETHVGGLQSPTSILDDPNSSSTSDGS